MGDFVSVVSEGERYVLIPFCYYSKLLVGLRRDALEEAV